MHVGQRLNAGGLTSSHLPVPSRNVRPRLTPHIVAKAQSLADISKEQNLEFQPQTPVPNGGSPQRERKPDKCKVYFDESERVIPVMPVDFGFRSGVGRLYQSKRRSVPVNVVTLALENFKKELVAVRRSVQRQDFKRIARKNPPKGFASNAASNALIGLEKLFQRCDEWLEEKDVVGELPALDVNSENLTDEQRQVLDKVRQLKLTNAKVAAREDARDAKRSPLPTMLAYKAMCWTLDMLYDGRPIQRFWILEVVARVPYMAWISILHLYESFGWWRAGAELRKVHFSQEWNEIHHLQIMESLGGDQLWIDRFVAEHAAIAYFGVITLFYLVSPTASYNFMELIETHAFDTYATFVDENAELLKSIPPPLVALQYYKGGDLYMFDEISTSRGEDPPRRPACNSLYDVFCNVRDDEGEHMKTMVACQNDTIALDLEELADIAADRPSC